MSIFFRKYWNQKPSQGVQIDQGNPLSNGIIFAAPFYENGSKPIDLISQSFGTVPTGAIWKNNGLDLSGTASPLVFSNVPQANLNLNNKFSVFFLGTKHAYDSAYGPILANSDGSNFSYAFGHNSSVGTFAFRLANSSTVTPGFTPVLGQQFSALGTYNGSKCSLYANGKLVGYSNFSTGVGSNPSYGIYINSNNVSQSSRVSVQCALIWNRCLNEREAELISNNPWQVFAPVKKINTWPPKPIYQTNISSNTGTAILDFGPAPGDNIATVKIEGLTGITSTSLCEVWKAGDADTVDHNKMEHLVADFDVNCSAPIEGQGFTIYGISRMGRLTGKFKVNWGWK